MFFRTVLVSSLAPLQVLRWSKYFSGFSNTISLILTTFPSNICVLYVPGGVLPMTSATFSSCWTLNNRPLNSLSKWGGGVINPNFRFKRPLFFNGHRHVCLVQKNTKGLSKGREGWQYQEKGRDVEGDKDGTVGRLDVSNHLGVLDWESRPDGQKHGWIKSGGRNKRNRRSNKGAWFNYLKSTYFSPLL